MVDNVDLERTLYRGDELCWRSEWQGGSHVTGALDSHFRFMDRFRTCLSAHVKLRNLTSSSDMMLSRFAGGARFGRHRDNDGQISGRDSRKRPDGRELSTTYYMGGDADSGALRLQLPYHDDRGYTLDVDPRLDRLVVFHSRHVEHEVLPSVGDQPRFACTMWLGTGLVVKS